MLLARSQPVNSLTQLHYNYRRQALFQEYTDNNKLHRLYESNKHSPTVHRFQTKKHTTLNRYQKHCLSALTNVTGCPASKECPDGLL